MFTYVLLMSSSAIVVFAGVTVTVSVLLVVSGSCVSDVTVAVLIYEPVAFTVVVNVTVVFAPLQG
ncbi:MAG: hypothetical protein IPO23_12155 [Flavobacterium sp.]|nr:hypothetical protein [Flavobacterium sp.]